VGGVKASAVIGVLLASVAAAEYSYRTAALLGDSLFRWWVLLVLIAPCVLGFYAESRPPQRPDEVPAGTKPRPTSPMRSSLFGMAGVAFAAFLIADVGSEVAGFFLPLECGNSGFGGGATTLVFKKPDGLICGAGLRCLVAPALRGLAG
jgi:hypothetical protein